MRSVAVFFLVVGGTLGTYIFLKDGFTFAPNVGHPNQMKTVGTSQNLGNKNNIRKDKQNESTSHVADSNAQGARDGEDEGDSISAHEIEKLSSIYHDQEGRESELESESAVDQNSELEPQPPARIAGVKVAAWVRSQKNQVNVHVPDPRIGEGMRFYVNCMEIKKRGASPIEERDCDKLVAHRTTAR